MTNENDTESRGREKAASELQKEISDRMVEKMIAEEREKQEQRRAKGVPPIPEWAHAMIKVGLEHRIPIGPEIASVLAMQRELENELENDMNAKDETSGLPPDIHDVEYWCRNRPATGHDPVNHPTHYTSHPSKVECITITEHMNFCQGNAIKYIWRAFQKGSPLEDLRKARWYLNREIERLEKQREDSPTK